MKTPHVSSVVPANHAVVSIIINPEKIELSGLVVKNAANARSVERHLMHGALRKTASDV